MTETPKLLRPGQMKEILQVSGMTVRNYVKAFEPYLSETATKKSGRRFTPKDVETLKHANALLREGATYEEIQHHFDQEIAAAIVGEIIQETDQPEPEPQTEEPPEEGSETDETTRAIATIEFLNAYMEQAQETISAKDATIEILQKDKDRLQKQLDYERQPLFKKWFTKPQED